MSRFDDHGYISGQLATAFSDKTQTAMIRPHGAAFDEPLVLVASPHAGLRFRQHVVVAKDQATGKYLVVSTPC